MAWTKEQQAAYAKEWYLRNKEITKLRAAKWKRDNPDRARKVETDWHNEHKDVMRKVKSDWNKRNPEKRRAGNMAARVYRDSRPAVCSDCGCSDRPIEGHHMDYSKPLEVVWLCHKCHMKRHRKYNF